jgi:choline dehydrogenase-like flavoprotein
MIFIVGSGLSAIAAAAALAARGIRPTILDVGIRPDAAAASLKMRLGSMEPEAWRADDVVPAKRTGPSSANGIPRKLYFGSDFAFQEAKQSVSLAAKGASMFRSFGLGGFSSVWGAVIQPVKDKDISGWPISIKDLDPHYATIDNLVGCSSAPQLHPSSQAKALFADLSANSDLLHRKGISFEYPRLAVRASESVGGKGCRYCGLCLFGCPYDSRYSAEITLGEFIRTGKVAYEPDMLVRRLVPSGSMVRIEGCSLGGDVRVFVAERVFLAAGLLESTRIILESLGVYGRPLRISHSDIFTVPLMRYRRSDGIQAEKLHTLCQLTAEVEDTSICAHRVHLQFYGYNELYRTLMGDRIGFLAKPLAPALEPLCGRLIVIFGYLHSDVSSTIQLMLSQEVNPAVILEGKPNPDARRVCRAVVRKLRRHHMCFKGITLQSQLKLDSPGGGYHSGGTLPMRRMPRAFETDSWGLLPSLPGVHVVDASVLPNVPASTTAFTVMANAHRIASEVPLP